MIYTDNENLKAEIKKFLIDCKLSQREIAARLDMSPQTLAHLLNKKNLSFSDVSRIAEAAGRKLFFDFKE